MLRMKTYKKQSTCNATCLHALHMIGKLFNKTACNAGQLRHGSPDILAFSYGGGSHWAPCLTCDSNGRIEDL
jgi:hypothetical protein